MNYTAYYVVRVREDRWAQMQEVLLDDSILFEEPTIWSQIVGGRTVKVPKDWLREMKLVYLAELHEEYLTTTPTSEEQSVFQSRLRALLGPLPWSTDTFDSWWDARAVDFECAVEDVRRLVFEATLEAIPGLRSVRVRSE